MTYDDEHTAAKDTCSSYTANRSTENQDSHIWRHCANERSELEDEDGEDDDVFGREDLGPLRVNQIEAEQREAGKVSAFLAACHELH